MSLKLKDLKQGNALVMGCASRGRNPENTSDRTAGCPTEQRLEPNFTGIANCITSVEKDCYILEISLEGENNCTFTNTNIKQETEMTTKIDI